MKTVFVNGRFLSQRLTGVHRFASEILFSFDRLLDQDPNWRNIARFVVLAPRNVTSEPEYRRLEMRVVGRLKGHAWEQVELPWYSRGGLLITLCGAMSLIKSYQIYVIHDAAVFATQYFTRLYSLWYKTVYRTAAARAQAVVTVSRFSASELSRYVGLDPDRIEIAHNGSDHMLRIIADERILRRLEVAPNSYVLVVGWRNLGKNFSMLSRAAEVIRALNHDLRFVVVGGEAANDLRPMRPEEQSGPATAVAAGRVTDGELKALFMQARLFVFPSSYEGFGIPPLEAMICGCPVAASDIPAHREVLGDAAVYFDSCDSEQLAKALVDIWSNSDFRQELVIRGRERAARFRWEQSAETLLGMVARILLRSSSPAGGPGRAADD